MGIETLAAILGFLTGIFGLVLSVLAVGNRFVNWLKAAIVEVLEDTGVIRHGDEGEENWPNGWKNLPDALDGIVETQKRLVEEKEKDP